MSEYLIDVKRGCHTLEEARKLAKEMVDETISLKNEYMTTVPIVVDSSVDKLMNDVLVDVLKTSFKTEIESMEVQE